MIISSAFSGNFGIDIALIGQLPKGEFKDEGVPTGFGLDINGLWYPSKQFGLGLNVGISQYGNSERQIPFSYYTDLVTITEKTTNDLAYGHLLLKLIPFQGNVRPYFEGLLGMKNLFTSTKVISENCPEEDEDTCEIASSTNYSDNAFSYGGGGGLEITLTSFGGDEDSGIKGVLSFFINARYMIGAEAEYLKEGAITFSDPQDGPVQTTFDPSTSKTDVLQISLGLNFNF
ncbi:MAG: hypothetical protein NZ825_04775 [Candidatus Marinimicrobia bacterium]|nr:hypothetical protein [Candidatus Neomarinimicrobiota bacterium]